jgi:hypothetical protein
MDSLVAKDAGSPEVHLLNKSDADNSTGTGTGYSWSPGIFNRLPFAALSALIIALLCTGAAVVVLAISDGKEVSSWPVQPSVYLSLISTVANFLIAYALAEGVTISFWRKSLRGSTLAELHRTWDYGSNMIGSVFAGRHLNLVAIACIMATVVGIDGPLFQRASVIETITTTGPTLITAQVAPFWPPTFITGYISGRSESTSVLSPAFSKVIQDFSNRVPITTGFHGCSGICRLQVKAVGLIPQCNTTQTKLDYYEPILKSTKHEFDFYTAFATNFTINYGALPYAGIRSAINMSVLSSTAGYIPFTNNTSESCPATFTYKQCFLLPANVTFPVTLSNNTATLDPLPPDALAYPSTRINFTDDAAYGTSLGGVALALSNLYTSDVEYHFGGAVGWELIPTGSLPDSYIELDEYAFYDFTEYCNLTYRDPTRDLLASINEIMFRTAIAVANGSSNGGPALGKPIATTSELTQILQATQASNRPVFRTHWAYLGHTVAIMALAVAAVAATLYGWWMLGRDMTLGPIDIARSFDAPVLTAAMANRSTVESADIDTVLKEIGDLRIKYGEVEDPTRTGKFEASTMSPEVPQHGLSRGGSKLGFGPADMVKEPACQGEDDVIVVDFRRYHRL